MVLTPSGCSFPLGTVAANKCSCGDQQQQQMGEVIRISQFFPIACTVKYYELDKNVNRLL